MKESKKIDALHVISHFGFQNLFLIRGVIPLVEHCYP
jgi:hypothetical protein